MTPRHDLEPTASPEARSQVGIRALLSAIQEAAERAGRMYRLQAAGREVVRGRMLDWFLRRGPSAIRRREDPGALTAYVWRIASRVARAQADTLSEKRRERGRVLEAFAGEAPFPSGPGASPEAPAGASRFLDACLSELTPHQREVVRLHVLQDRTLEEAAFCLGTTRNAARQASRRAIARLRRHADELTSAIGCPPRGVRSIRTSRRMTSNPAPRTPLSSDGRRLTDEVAAPTGSA